MAQSNGGKQFCFSNHVLLVDRHMLCNLEDMSEVLPSFCGCLAVVSWVGIIH